MFLNLFLPVATDFKTCAAALTALSDFLRARRSLSDTDAQKLWTGLFFAMWMADGPRAQQALASDLAGLIRAAAATPALPEAWQRGFWAVMGARWTEIDALRLDKFLLLVRRVLAAALAACPDMVPGVLGAAGAPLDPDPAGRVPLGLRLHVLDVWVDECERCGLLERAEVEDEEAGVAGQLAALVEAVAAAGISKAVSAAAEESLLDKRLWWRTVDRLEDDNLDDWEGFD